jgi:hypothetical protein
VLVDGAEQVLPLAAQSNVYLVNALGVQSMTLVRTDPLLYPGRIVLSPAEDSAWVDCDAALGHHLSNITIADAVFTIPANTQQDDLDWKSPALE